MTQFLILTDQDDDKIRLNINIIDEYYSSYDTNTKIPYTCIWSRGGRRDVKETVEEIDAAIAQLYGTVKAVGSLTDTVVDPVMNPYIALPESL